MSQQLRNPITITDKFPVGRKFTVYCQDGLSNEWGKWSAIVKGLDLNKEEITISLSQDWEGADMRGGQYWVETRTIKFKDFLIPLL